MAERLSLAGRTRVEAYTNARTKPKEIARLIGRDPSTVYRDLDRGRRSAGPPARPSGAT